VGSRRRQSEIVREAWPHRHDPVLNAITSRSFSAVPFTALEIYYDPADVAGASKRDIIDALIKAGKR
jgi:hypothetical protein